MVTWQDYLHQSQTDKDACLILYDKGHYGLAAYCMQQALEKIAKAFLFKHGLHAIPLRTHSPLLFIEQILPFLARIEDKAKQHNIPFKRGQSADRHDSYIEQCIKVKQDLNNECFKRAIWKNSLNIALDAQEQMVFAKYPDFRDYYRFNLTEILDIGNDADKGKKFVDTINTESSTRNGAFYRTMAMYARMIVATFPHEEYGRYPIDLPVKGATMLTITLYNKHRTDLKEMIDVVMQEIPARKG